MIQKKICMVGVFATGKTSMVRRFVESIFSERYHSTVGVKIDRKRVRVRDDDVNLLLWDLEGKTESEGLRTSYLRGAAGVIYVADGTRRDTYDQLFSLRQDVEATLGRVASVVALNKRDLTDLWQLEQMDYDRLADKGLRCILTSAKTGEGVEDAFMWLASEVLEEVRGESSE